MTAPIFSSTFGTPLVSALVERHRHGGRFIGLIVIVVIIAVVALVLAQRRRDRRPIEAAAPPAEHRAESVDLPTRVPDSAIVRAETPRVPAPPVAVRARPQLPSGRYGILGLLRSEWTKLRTVRSTIWTLGVTVILGIGISALSAWVTRSHWTPSDQIGFDPAGLSLVGVFIAQFAIGVLGALVISAEYGTGTIRATFSAAPRRPLVLVAKTVVFGVVALVVAEVVAFLAFFLGQALLTAPAIHTTIGAPDSLRQVVGSGLYVAVLGLFALGLAAIIRHSAGAISAFVAILLVLPLLTAALPNSIALDVRRFLPDRIGSVMISIDPGPHVFSPWVGLLVLCGYAAASLVIGGVLLVRRDT